MKLSVFLKKMFADQRSSCRERGQAVIEYILVLVITVSIILGILYQFNDAFKGFLDRYFGDYVACLLETGELPALGGAGPGADLCNAQFQTFSVSSGQSLKPTGGGGDGNSNDDSSGSSSSSSDSNNNQAGSSSRPSQVQSSGGVGNAEVSGTGAGSLRPKRQRYRGRQQGSRAKEAGLDGEESSGRLGRRQGLRRRVIYLGESYNSKKKKDRPKKIVTQGKKSAKARDIAAMRKARQPLNLPEAQSQQSNLDGGGLSLGQFIKILIISAIVIALFLFLGGQALQIRKSWEKGE